MIKFQSGKFMKVLAILLLAVLVVIAALPASSSHTCVAGSDDYDQCVGSTAPPNADTIAPQGTADNETWAQPSGPECDDDPDTPAPSCD